MPTVHSSWTAKLHYKLKSHIDLHTHASSISDNHINLTLDVLTACRATVRHCKSIKFGVVNVNVNQLFFVWLK